jgi:7-cyano-7-deazaguanine synthase
MSKKAIILLSEGLDSATTAAITSAAGYQLIALSCRYGQRHDRELAAAKKIANFLQI